MISGGDVFGRQLGMEDGALMDRISALKKDTSRELSGPFCHVTIVRRTTVNQEAGSHGSPHLLTP